jgi:CubicO group peptidase (beta-lactamase class C family)
MAPALRLALAALLATPVPAAAQQAARASTAAAPVATTPASTASPRRGPTDPAELQGFLDGLMAAWLRDTHIAGATVAVVRDGQVLLTRGYGLANVATRQPVDGDRTLFRIGSISKLFTWTAVMQLVEEGKLDLDADVNRYLDFTIPATFAQPITLRHLLTHTPGFEEDPRDLFTTDTTRVAAMQAWLPAHMPARVRPPGTFSAYSNYGTALAGYIVQRVAGKSYDEVLETRIFGPLGMTHTSARQPLPGPLRPQMSQGFAWENGRFTAKPWEIVTGAAPAGSMSSPAGDMARFMLAHLGGGAYNGARILKDSTTAAMHTRAFTHDPRLPGFALGFYEQDSHGLHIIGHGGDTQWFHSILWLIPAEGLGVFMSTNTNVGGSISFAPFREAFLDHYYPTAPRPRIALNPAQAARIAGTYLFNRTNYTTWLKVTGLLEPLTVSVGDSGTLRANLGMGDPMTLVPVDTLLFQDPVGGGLVSFRADASGRITHGFLGMAPMMAMEKREGLANPRLHQGVLGAALVVFLGLVVAALVRWLNRKAWQVTWPDRYRRARTLMLLVALGQLLFVGLVVTFASNTEKLLAGPYTLLEAALALPVLGGLGTLAAGWLAVGLWRTGEATLGARLRLTATTLTGITYFVVLNAWNLLGWKF